MKWTKAERLFRRAQRTAQPNLPAPTVTPPTALEHLPNMRPCERVCRTCKQPLSFSRFRRYISHGISRFALDCNSCEQKSRNEKKNEDRPLTIIKNRARRRAAQLGVSFDFVWTNLNWQALVPWFRALMTTEGRCLSCGHPFGGEPDVHIDHILPPRPEKGQIDRARESARNIHLKCSSCNKTKSNIPFDRWLDDMEEARMSNEKEQEQRPSTIHTLFGDGDDINIT